MATIDDIGDWFTDRDREAWDAFAQGADVPSEQDVADLEAEIGFRLPDQVRELAFHPLGGLFIEAKEELWPQPQAHDVGPAWTFQNGLMAFSLSEEAPEWMQTRTALDRFREYFPDLTGRLPVLKRSSDPLMWTINAEGELAMFIPGLEDEPSIFEGDFFDLVLDEIRELVERLARKLAGEDRAS
ncbi:hypothetical protein [Aestuariimicrobium sp. Y1814]|uniref:hypothetical protein n=1 Tax=Aestuariimicrobium sp. Y1814 TaxID=3418742 RepID=UPI003DA7A695